MKTTKPQGARGIQRKTNGRKLRLLALLERNGPLYGLGLMERYNRFSSIEMPIGSLYTVLQRLAEEELIQGELRESSHPEGGNRRKYYAITEAGREVLDQELGDR